MLEFMVGKIDNFYDLFRRRILLDVDVIKEVFVKRRIV